MGACNTQKMVKIHNTHTHTHFKVDSIQKELENVKQELGAFLNSVFSLLGNISAPLKNYDPVLWMLHSDPA